MARRRAADTAWLWVFYVACGLLSAGAFMKIAAVDPRESIGGAQSIYEPLLLLISTGLLLLRLRLLVPWRVLVSGPLLSVAMYAVYATASSLWSVGPALSAGKGIELLLVLLNGTLFVHALYADRLGDSAFGVMALSLLAVAAAFLVVNTFTYGTPLYLTGGDQYDSRTRLLLAYTHPLVVADLAAFGLLCTLCSHLRWSLKLVVLAAFIGLMVMTQSRASALGLGLSALTFVMLRRQQGSALTRRLLVLFALAAGGALVGAWWVSSNEEVWASLPPEVQTLDGRLGLWASVLDLSFSELSRTLFGYGYFAARFVLLDSFAWAGHSHQTLLEVLLTTGLVGLGILAVFLGAAFSLAVRHVHLAVFVPYLLVVGFDNPNLLQPDLTMLVVVWVLVATLASERAIRQPRQVPTARQAG